MRALKIILAVVLSVTALCLALFAGFILLDPVVGTEQPPVTLDTDHIFVPQEPEATAQEEEPAPELPEEELPPVEEEEVPAEPVEDEAVTFAKAYAENMTLEEKIWQLFFVTPESLTGVNQATLAGETTKKSLEARPVGGIVYFAKNLEDKEQVQKLLSGTQSFSKTPLFLGVDEEGGLVSRVGGNEAIGTTLHPAAAEIGKTADMKTAYDTGAAMAAELRELGFNMNFAPVADIITEPENTEIGSRAYSSDPETAAAMVSATVRGLQQNGMVSCLKHFPGHGSTKADSHEGTSVSVRTVDELQENEWVPFRAGIEQGAAFVMLSHLTNENLSENPASLSVEVGAYLRQELKFEGIVITDSLQMGAIVDHYQSGEAAVMALWAGADMLLMPNDLQKAYDAVHTAVEAGALTEERITESVERIIATKYRFGMIREETAQ